jgi:hypothetical protein
MLNKPFTLPVSTSRPLDFGVAWYLPGTLLATRQPSGPLPSPYQPENAGSFRSLSKSGPLRAYQQSRRVMVLLSLETHP